MPRPTSRRADTDKNRLRLLRAQRQIARIGDWLEAVMVVIASVLLAFLVLALFLQVLFRYVLKDPLPWTEEGAGFALVWYALVAAAFAARKGQQFVFRWATLPLPGGVQKGLRQIVNVLTIVFLVFLLLQSVAYFSLVSDETATNTHVSLWLPYAGLAIGFTALIIVYIFDTLDVMLGLFTKETLSRRELQEAFMYRILSGEAIPDDDPEESITMRP